MAGLLRNSKWCVALVGLMMLSLPVSVNAKKFYRFQVDDKVMMFDHVPSEYQHLGYQVLNGRGLVVDEIAPAPTEEELRLLREQEMAEKARQKTIRAQRTIDENLLRLYVSTQDIERARDRKVDEVNAYIRLQQSSVDDLSDKLSKAQAQAANIERRGNTVSKDLLDEIALLRRGVRDGKRAIEQRQREVETITNEYNAQRERFQVLQVYPVGTLPEDVDMARVTRK